MTSTIMIDSIPEYYSELTGRAYKTEKSKKIAESKHLTRLARKGKRAVTIELGIDDTYAKPKKPLLEQLFIESKWITNDIIHHLETDNGKLKDWDYTKKSVTVRMGKDSNTYEDRELTILPSAVKQSLRDRTGDNLSSLHVLKENNHKVGALKYVKSVDSIPLRKIGNDYNLDTDNRKIYIARIGWLKVHGLKQLPQDADIANAVFLKTPRGYVLKVTYYDDPIMYSFTPGTIVGLDFGVKTFLTSSDSLEYTNSIPPTPRLKNLQRKLSRQKKGSNNYIKTVCAIQKCYHDISNQKDDLANKLVNFLLNTYEIIVMQDESLKAWQRLWGKKLHHALLGRVKKKLKDHPRVVILSKWAPTTQWCPCCEKLNKHGLDKRTYSCACGYSEDRDLHAAKNMIRLAVLKPELRMTNQELDLLWVYGSYPDLLTPSVGCAGV